MKIMHMTLGAFACAEALTKPFSPFPVSKSASVLSQRLADSNSGRERRTLQSNPCSLCADGSEYTIEGTLPPTEDGVTTTCSEAAAAAPSIGADDPVCSLLRIAGRHCGCPHVAPEGACNVCYDGSSVEADNIVDASAIELTGIDVSMKDLGLPDGSGAAVSCGELETNMHTLYLIGSLEYLENVEVEEGYDENLAYLCTFFQNFAGPQCGCPANPDAEYCVACPDGILDPDLVTKLGSQSLTCAEAQELIKPIPPGSLCDEIKARPPPGCACAILSEVATTPTILSEVATTPSDASLPVGFLIGRVIMCATMNVIIAAML